MMPLWAIDYEEESKPLKKVWFSDGGITSNFPIHRFDAIFPRWPTLGINLQYTDAQGAAARCSANTDPVFLPADRKQGVNDLWLSAVGNGSPASGVAGFIKAILWSSRVWHDNSFLKLPGYRDRVVEIWLRPDEGGLNLSMPEDVIKRLIDLGREGGIRLRDRFSDADDFEAMSWTGHRWTRYRSAMAGLTAALQQFRQSVANCMPSDVPLRELLSDRDRPPCYKFKSESQRQASEEATNALLRYLEVLETTSEIPDDTAEYLQRPFHDPPSPPVEFGSRAPI
jgi:predicted acylesterase/phospholipase RssA